MSSYLIMLVDNTKHIELQLLFRSSMSIPRGKWPIAMLGTQQNNMIEIDLFLVNLCLCFYTTASSQRIANVYRAAEFSNQGK